jgi:hypothetical protein
MYSPAAFGRLFIDLRQRRVYLSIFWIVAVIITCFVVGVASFAVCSTTVAEGNGAEGKKGNQRENSNCFFQLSS